MQRTAIVAALLGLLLVGSNASGQDRARVTPTPCEGLAGSDAASCEREWQRGVNAEAKAHGITPEEAGQRAWLITLTAPRLREIHGVIPVDEQGPVWFHSRGDGNLEIGVVSPTSSPEQEEATIRAHLADVFPDPQTAAFVSGRLTVYSVPRSHSAVLQTYARLNSEVPGWPVYSQVLRFGVEMHEGREYVGVVARPSATAAQLATIRELTTAYAPIAYTREAQPEDLRVSVSKVGRKRLTSCRHARQQKRCRRMLARGRFGELRIRERVKNPSRVYIEGAYQYARVIRLRDGDVVYRKRRLATPLAARLSLVPGYYRIESWTRVCSGNCRRLSPAWYPCRGKFRVRTGGYVTATISTEAGTHCSITNP
jgi:hypothetical protein